MVVSWPIRDGFFHQATPIVYPETNTSRIELIKTFAETWAEPFRSLAHSIPSATDVKALELYDWPPPRGLRTTGHVVLAGDALHPMSMCEFDSPPSLAKASVGRGNILSHTKTDRGEGANHAILDVLDLVELVMPHFTNPNSSESPVAAVDSLRAALDLYEEKAVSRSRPAVLASRQAALDAHQWSRIKATSPLLSRRAMDLAFDEGDME